MSEPLFASLFDETERRPLTVSELTQSVRKAIEARFSSVWVEGEKFCTMGSINSEPAAPAKTKRERLVRRHNLSQINSDTWAQGAHTNRVLYKSR
jgi:hypothetical protein